MDQASLQELQSFRELEGLVAPRRGRSARLMSHSLASSPSLRALSPRQAGSLERREDGRQPGQLLRVQESSYVADAEFNTNLVLDTINPCGTWGVGGAPRVGARRGCELALVQEYRLSAPVRLLEEWGRFSLGRRREEGESLALADHLMWRSRRGSGGRGWSGRDWPHHPNFDTDPPERAPERWEEANQVLQMAQDALRHQWMADVPPAAPTRPQRWVPPGVVSR